MGSARVLRRHKETGMGQLLKARAIAFYLPQYHPIDINDNFWGKGFTEWTNVTKAKPLFPGHKQPKLPADLGFYDLRVKEVRHHQAELAREAGIEGFCYWHYWFGNGNRVLERIFDEIVASGEPDLPFCLGWANETWTGRWHGLDNEILIEQQYFGKEDYLNHFETILPALKDDRYIKVNGRNLFLIYRPYEIPDLNEFVDYWQELTREHKIPEFFFISVTDEAEKLPDSILGFTNSNLVRGLQQKSFSRFMFKKPPMSLQIYDYESLVNTRLNSELKPRQIPMVIPNWDNTPRSGKNGRIFLDSNPELYGKWLKGEILKVKDKPIEERIIFIKSWNEWAEGNYIEPDQEFGHAYLKATKEALKG